MRTFLSFVIFASFLLILPTQADNSFQQRADSLRQVIDASKGKEKLNAFDKLQNLYFLNLSDKESLDAFLEISEQYDKELERQSDSKKRGDLMVSNIIAMNRCGQFDAVEKNAEQTIQYLKSNHHTEAQYVVYKQLILAQCEQGKFDKALDELKKVFDDAKTNNDLEGQFYAQYLTGVVYMHQERLADAEAQYRVSLETGKKMKKKPFDIINASMELCNMLQVTGQMDEFFVANENAEKLLKEMEKESDGKRNFTTDWGNLYIVNAFAYQTLKDYDQVLYYCDKIEGLGLANPSMMYNLKVMRAQTYDAQKQYDKALQYINEAIESSPVMVHSRYAKVEILSHIENAPRTWMEIEKTVQYSDSIRNATFNKQLDELRTRYDVDKLTAEKEIDRQRRIIATVTVGLLLILLLIYILYSRRLKRKNETLYRQVQELTRKEKAVEQCLISRPEESLTQEMQLFQRLSKYINAEKTFTDPDLTRKKLADLIGSNETYLANSIREGAGETFSAYISNLRLQYAVELLDKNPDITLDAVAVDSGHGSYSPFYRSFTKKYGITPSEYRKLSLSTEKK